MKYPGHFAAAAACLLLMTGGAGATPLGAPPAGPGPHQGMMTRMDANGDGKVTLEEFKSGKQDMLQQRFTQMDANGDGNLTLQEYTAAHDARAEQRFQRLDANGDGAVDQDELQAARRSMRDRPWLTPAPGSGSAQ